MYNPLFDYIIRNSNWYKDQFEDAERIKKAPHNLDIINFGSNPAKYDLDYSESGIKGYNFAVGPQTLTFDYVMLKNYHTFFRNSGPRILLFLFCPFNFCKDFHTKNNGTVYKNLRYYPILDKSSIPNFDEDLYEKMIAHPSRLGLRALYHSIRQIHRNGIMNIESNPLTDEQMKNDAIRRIKGWEREFLLNDLDSNHLSDLVKRSLLYNSKIMDDINDFCSNNNINMKILIPPLSKELNVLIPDDFKERCLYSIIRNKKIPIYDYINDKELVKKEYFLDSLFLNKKGRVKFTNKVVDNLNVIL